MGGFDGMLLAMNFPDFERNILTGILLQGYQLGLFISLPMAATLGLLLI